MTANRDDLLTKYGYNESSNYSIPENASAASIESLKRFLNRHSEAVDMESVGLIHITGPAVKGNTAPLKAVGNLMIAIQEGIDAVGGALDGFTALSGKLPSRIAGRTEISLVASPLPGSVVLQVAPARKRKDDLEPDGDTLFNLEELGISPLADEAFREFSSLLQELAKEGPDKSEFIEHLTELGPRTANAMKKFCDTVDNSDVDIDFSWNEPGKERETAEISHIFAKHASLVIENAHIDSEQVAVVGTIVTITESTKDKLRVRLDNDQGEITLALGSIDPTDLIPIHMGDRVEINATRTTSSRAGGRNSSKLEGVSISPLPKLIN